MVWVLLGALMIGLTLGMLGSGGSAITVPVLIYWVGHGTKESIAESMAIVGLISVVAAVPYARNHQIDWRSVWWFGIPGMLGTFLGAMLGGIAANAVQLSVFGTVLFVAAATMLQKPRATEINQHTIADKDRSPEWLVALQGILVGILTGFVGVGGGFLIVPALVILSRLPMRLAVGTSLVIISINAVVGFTKYEHYLSVHNRSIDLHTIGLFTIIGVAGSFLGRCINQRLDQVLLRRVFAGFLIVLGSFVIFQEGSKLLHSRAAPTQGAVQPLLSPDTATDKGHVTYDTHARRWRATPRRFKYTGRLNEIA